MQKETGKRTVGEGREQQKISEKACYIVGAGSFEKLDSLPQEGDLVIAADGGYAYLKQLGIQPDVLLGDFDSLEYVPEHDHILRHSPIKDDTDMALAAFYAQEKGYRRKKTGSYDGKLSAADRIVACRNEGLSDRRK